MTTAPSMAASSPTIIPAQVGFLAIFNPSLGNTDETLDDQIVYYSSVESQTQKRRRYRRAPSSHPTENVPQDERNERLRQIGLAQGMVSFGKNFSGDQDVDTIETEKTRVVLHELEPGWWILAVCQCCSPGIYFFYLHMKFVLIFSVLKYKKKVYRLDTVASTCSLKVQGS